MPRKLIGIFGGAFDPVHNGHYAITKHCIEKLCMEKIIVVPTGTSPLNKKLTNDNFRLEMLHKVFHEDCYEISEYEVLQSKKNNNPTYTIDTLKYLTARDEQTSCLYYGDGFIAKLAPMVSMGVFIELLPLYSHSKKG